MTLPVTAGLVHHVDAGVGVTVASGKVAILADQSASGNHMTPIGPDDGPTLVEGGLNGRNYLAFNGVDQSLEKANPVNLPERDDDRSIFLLGRFPSTGPTPHIGFAYGRNQADQAFPFKMDASGNWLVDIAFTPTDYKADVGGLDEWAIWAATHEDDGNVLRFYKNGLGVGVTAGTSVFTGSTSMDSIRMGRGLDGSLSEFNAAELIVFDRLLSSIELAAMASYFFAKYTLALGAVGRYWRAIQQLMPPGKAWTRAFGSRLTKLHFAIAREPQRVHARIGDFLLEQDPRTCVETIDDWERTFSLPDDCFPQLTVLSERRALVVLRWLSRKAPGGASQTLIDLADALGYTGTDFELRRFHLSPFTCESSCDSYLNSEEAGWMLTYEYIATHQSDSLDSNLRCQIRETLLSALGYSVAHPLLNLNDATFDRSGTAIHYDPVTANQETLAEDELGSAYVGF